MTAYSSLTPIFGLPGPVYRLGEDTSKGRAGDDPPGTADGPIFRSAPEVQLKASAFDPYQSNT